LHAVRATDTTVLGHMQSMGCTSLTCGGHSLKPHSNHCRKHNLLSHITYDRHTHCGHILHLPQTVSQCSTFLWLYASDDQPYRNHAQP